LAQQIEKFPINTDKITTRNQPL